MKAGKPLKTAKLTYIASYACEFFDFLRSQKFRFEFPYLSKI